MDTVFHEIEPIFNRDSKILILGSFPSVKSREGHFFYNHPQNRFWKVLAKNFQLRSTSNNRRKETIFAE